MFSAVHVMSGDLILHKRTLGPIKTLVYGLRRYDLDRCAALIDASSPVKGKVEGYMSPKAIIYLVGLYTNIRLLLCTILIIVFCSFEIGGRHRPYGICFDQLGYVWGCRRESDQFYFQCKSFHYVDGFNVCLTILTHCQMVSIDMNKVMYVLPVFCLENQIQSDTRRRLTMATIIFLPLTLLTGYFVSQKETTFF